ncbi:MAG: hypothetical protein IPO81_02895 [Kouleothrix sp.]|nr:hypothetical protein [Kouleothrix sp.]
MKISQHPRMRDIVIGDEVYSYKLQLFARVEEVFPAAVCVKVGILSVHRHLDLQISPQLWRADDIENLSVCRHCGCRDRLISETQTGIPRRVCERCCIVPPDDRRVREVGSWW